MKISSVSPSRGGTELREIRDDADDLRREIDSLPRDRTTGSTAILGQIVGAPGSSSPSWVTVQPVRIVGTPAEGVSATITNVGNTFSAFLINGTPTAGDFVNCRVSRGNWVAEKCACGGTTPSCFTGCGCINVGQTIRVADSTLGIAVDVVYSGSASSNPWGRAPSWGGRASYAYPGDGTEDGCQAKTVPIWYNLDAAACKLSVGWYADVGGTECPINVTTNPAKFVSFDVPSFLEISSTCDPFERSYDFFDGSVGSDPTAWNILYNSSQTSLSVTSPYSTTKCCVRFVIDGCNALPLPGATVKVWTDSSKTTLLGQGVTDSGGSVIVDVKSHGSVYYEASSDRFVTGNRTVTVSACGNSVGILTLTPASGYHCIVGTSCVYPFKDTMFATDRYGNATTVVFDGAGTAGWKGASPTFGYPGCSGCAAVPGFSYDILLEQLGGDLQLQWKRAGASGPPASCPGTVTDVGFQGTSNNNFICPPVGATYFHVANPSDSDTNNLFCSTLGDHDFIITE